MSLKERLYIDEWRTLITEIATEPWSVGELIALAVVLAVVSGLIALIAMKRKKRRGPGFVIVLATPVAFLLAANLFQHPLAALAGPVFVQWFIALYVITDKDNAAWC